MKKKNIKYTLFHDFGTYILCIRTVAISGHFVSILTLFDIVNVYLYVRIKRIRYRY